jgi:hypothetical protein
MTTLPLSRIAPVAAKIRFKGVLEAAYLLRFLLQNKANAQIRSEMTRLFGAHWNRANQERRYYDLLRAYVNHHHEADYLRFLMKHDIRLRIKDHRSLRGNLVRYLTAEQGLHGGCEVVNDLG